MTSISYREFFLTCKYVSMIKGLSKLVMFSSEFLHGTGQGKNNKHTQLTEYVHWLSSFGKARLLQVHFCEFLLSIPITHGCFTSGLHHVLRGLLTCFPNLFPHLQSYTFLPFFTPLTIIFLKDKADHIYFLPFAFL